MELAKNGIGTTRPNPSVGAVVVFGDKIIGEGFTSPYGGNHAEVNAINSVRDKSLLEKATIYVTLEPCTHYGKTPPCADFIINHNIKNVMIGCVDSNNLVSGKGIERLKNAGCNVVVGVLEEECFEHHKRFFTVQNKNRPYIILKWAETKDGFIAPIYTKTNSEINEQKPIWISNSYSQQLVHKWRSEEHSILIGTNTAMADNPKLNVRNWSGNNPVRIVLDKKLRISKEANLFDRSVKTIVLIEDARIKRKEKRENLIYEEINFLENIAKQICVILQKHQIQSVLIEGGTETLQAFINANLWDEARVFIGNTEFGNGVKSPVFSGSYGLDLQSEQNIGGDVLKIYKNCELQITNYNF